MGIVQAPEPEVEYGTDLSEYVKTHPQPILCFEPLSVELVKTNSYGERQIVKAIVFAWEGGKIIELGDCSVWWVRVRQQLSAAVETGDMVVGRLVQSGRAYQLDPIETAELAKIEKALAADGDREPF